jgi:hypothetical protein
MPLGEETYEKRLVRVDEQHRPIVVLQAAKGERLECPRCCGGSD